MSEPKTEKGKALVALLSYNVASTDWDQAAGSFANEVRGDVHATLDELGVPKDPDIAGRIRMLHDRSIDVIAPAHKALDEAGAPPSLDMAKRIRALSSARDVPSDDVTHAHFDMTWAGVPQGAGTLGERVRWLINERTRLLGATNNGGAPARLTENALNACKAFDAPTDPSDAVVYLATLLDERDAVREELRAIIVEAIKGRGEP